MRSVVLFVTILGVLAPGCDTESGEPDEEMVEDDYLGREAVTSIPAGDARGDAFSGDYQTRATVVSCAGECGPFEAGETTYMVCERDAESVEWVSATQTDGALMVRLDDDGHIGINLDGYVPIVLEGGIHADGRWEVGGYDTKFGESLESTARARGSAQPDEPLEGTLEVHSFGVVGDVEIDCRTTHRLVSVEVPE